MQSTPPFSLIASVTFALLLGACAPSGAPAPSTDVSPPPAARTVQPGAPGEPTRLISGTIPDEMGGTAWTTADAAFMRGMIPHHAQALRMTALVPDRAASRGVRQMALRMEISQRDEIALMERWLRDRGQDVPAWGHIQHGDHAAMGDMPMMPGMLTPQQMSRLEAAEGAEFDRLFLEYMIQHHEGAIVMVGTLFSTDGAGQESEIFQFASHVDADQRAEIARMRELLTSYR